MIKIVITIEERGDDVSTRVDGEASDDATKAEYKISANVLNGMQEGLVENGSQLIKRVIVEKDGTNGNFNDEMFKR